MKMTLEFNTDHFDENQEFIRAIGATGLCIFISRFEEKMYQFGNRGTDVTVDELFKTWNECKTPEVNFVMENFI